MAVTPIALPPALPSELLEYVLTHQAYPTTLIICQPRGIFLSSLLQAVQHTSPAPPPPPPEPGLDASSDVGTHEEQPQRHQLLIPTLHQVATSRSINLVFIPTVTHLHAYLSVFPGPDLIEAPPEQEWTKGRRKVPLLVIYGMLGLHRDTSEWSAQGLGNSLSGCVEAGWRSGRRVVVLEERKVDDDTCGEIDEEALLDEDDPERLTEQTCKAWEERVPMLNGSIRRAGLESEDGGWSGRTVEVGRILARWFRFRKGDWENKDTTLLERNV